MHLKVEYIHVPSNSRQLEGETSLFLSTHICRLTLSLKEIKMWMPRINYKISNNSLRVKCQVSCYNFTVFFPEGAFCFKVHESMSNANAVRIRQQNTLIVFNKFCFHISI